MPADPTMSLEAAAEVQTHNGKPPQELSRAMSLNSMPPPSPMGGGQRSVRSPESPSLKKKLFGGFPSFNKRSTPPLAPAVSTTTEQHVHHHHHHHHHHHYHHHHHHYGNAEGQALTLTTEETKTQTNTVTTDAPVLQATPEEEECVEEESNL